MATTTTTINYDSEHQQSKKAKSYGFFQLFRHADRLDTCLMLIGLVLAAAQGAGLPLGLYFFYSQILNSMLAYTPCFKQVRYDLATITAAEQNGTLSDLSPRLAAFRNSSDFATMKRYESLATDDGYSLFSDVGPQCGYYALIGFVMFIAGSLHIACWTIAGQRQISRIRSLLLRSMLSKDISWFDARQTGKLSNVLFESIRKMEDGMTSKISISLAWLSLTMTGYIVAFVTNWRVTIVTFSLVPLLFFVSFVMIRLVRMYSTKQTEAYGSAGSIAHEVLANLRTVVAFNKQEFEVERYRRHLNDSARMGMFKTVSAGVARGVASLIIDAITALCFWWGNSPQVQEAGGNVMQIMFSITMATNSLGNAAPNLECVASALSGADEVFAIIDEPPLIDNFSKDGEQLAELKGEVKLSDVSFAFPTRPQRQVLKSFSLDIKPGQTVALVGPSGCGKSTTAQLLMRFYDVTDGRITIDGVDVRKLNVRWLRQQIGFVSQEPTLFNTTIKENVSLGATFPTNDEDVIEACKLANAHAFISKLPNGYETVVGERGSQLSGGQKQRIAIARALISNPKILILDEATSALDTANEKAVQEALDKARIGRTTLIIAHRLSTVRNANLIAVIDGGIIVELGDHSTLIAQDGLYSRLVKTQEVEAEKVETENNQSVERSYETDEYNDFRSFRRSTVAETEIKSSSSPFSTVLRWGRPELHLTIICGVLSAVTAGFQPAFGLLVSEFMASFCPGDTQDKFRALIGITIGCGVVHTVLLSVQHYLFAIINEPLTSRTRCRILGKLLRMDAAWLDRPENQPSILTRILATNCVDIQGLSGVRISIYLTTLVIVGFAVVFSLVIEYRCALALVALMPLIVISSMFYQKMIVDTKKEEKASATSKKNNAVVAMDAISNMRTVMALGAEQFFLDKFTKQHDDLRKTAIRKGILSGPLLSFVMSSMLWGGAITFCLGSWLMEKNETTFLNVVRVYVLITFTGMAIGRTTSIVPDEDKAGKAVGGLMAILEEKPTIDDDAGSCNNSSFGKQHSGRIEFKNVSFRYPTRPSVPVLNNVSFVVEPGQRVALCGPSGGGKSTVIQLVQRFYDADSGAVLIDGVDIRQESARAVRYLIGHVSQEPVLFASLSVGENISYGSKETTAEDIADACRQANINEFLERLPGGLQAHVGERGAQLSGGQKQRIAIARALVRNPKILLLDEATSALDAESERIVQEALDSASFGRTALTVAHRLSTIQKADRILVLANGTVVEQGTHNDLMALGGVYFKLHRAQREFDK